MKLYKILNVDGLACHGGRGSWSLPEGDQPGEWMPEIEGEIIPCKNGYHLCRENDLIEWIGPAIFEAEYEGEIVDAGSKVVVRRARLIRRTKWNDKTARLFAADCAERVLHIAAARAAVQAAARYAAQYAAEAAERKWQTERLMQYLSGDVR